MRTNKKTQILQAIEEIVEKLVVRRDSLAGKPLGLGVTRS